MIAMYGIVTDALKSGASPCLAVWLFEIASGKEREARDMIYEGLRSKTNV